MKLKSRTFMLVFAAALIPILTGIYIHYDGYISLPFKCAYTTDYIYSEEGSKNEVHLVQDLRIYSPRSAYFLLNGTAQSGNERYQIKRAYLLSDGEFEQGKTFRFRIGEMSRMENDNVPEFIISKIIQEYSVGADTLQFDIFNLRHRTYLIGGPYTFLSTCQRY